MRSFMCNFDSQLCSFIHIFFKNQIRILSLFENLPSLLNIGTLESHNHLLLYIHSLECLQDSLGQFVTPKNTSEYVNENTLDFRVTTD